MLIPPRAGRQRWRGSLLSAAIGLIAASAGAIARLPFAALLGSEFAFLTFYPAVAVGAWAGGFVGGIVALASSLLLTALVVEPTVSASTAAATALFVGAGILVSALGGQLRRSRASAETAAQRARFVADAAQALSESIDRQITLHALAHTLVPRFADWCAIDLFDEDLAFEGAVIVAPDGDTAQIAHQIRAEYPYSPDAPAGVACVARTGQSEFVPRVSDGFLDQLPGGLRELIAALAIRSFISVPMQAPGGKTLGVLSVFMSGSGRLFAGEDIELAADIAKRAAISVAHADLLTEAQSRREELEAVIGEIDDAVLLTNRAGKVSVQNQAALAIVGDVLGADLDELLASLEPAPGADELRLTPSGRYVVPRSVRSAGLRDGAQVAMLVDRTDVVATDVARDAFVGMLSHELRTPITTIYASAQLLRRDPPAETRLELIAELVADTERLYQLVEDLLVLSRYERGRLDAALEPVLLGHLIPQAVRAEAAHYPAMRADVVVPPGLPTVMADPTYLRQIVRNLVSNAAKYAGPAPHIVVTASASADGLRVEFADDGPGVPPDAAARIFELFERLPADEAKPGAGIGLFVCRQLATLMGGRLELASNTSSGACFVLELPTAEADGDTVGGASEGEHVPPATIA